MKVLIIGAKGMLGQALAHEFVADQPVLWDREEADITDAKEVSRKLRTMSPDVIINAAGYTDVDGAEANQDLAYELNTKAPETLAHVCNEIGAIFVHYGSAYIFDGTKTEGYREDDEPNPRSVYGQTKLGGERSASLAKKFYVLRLDRLFGKAGTGKKSFVEKILESAKSKNEIEAIDEEAGSPTYAPDLARQTRYVLEHHLPYGIYHAANSGSCTWYGFAAEIFKISRISATLKPVPASRFPRSATRPKFAILLNTKLPSVRSWQEALKEFLMANNTFSKS